uniref:Cilia- and flagella-associated protein 36 n=1 Tax=Bicosoecida sp. CB-2014 TaxID=1486930 RepID=A0A7S1CBD1_9STRA|mmetsp:Transcript_20321/g.71891  ORF Transcript_20321/g.71891 Transcript_20321/m.71891 type:complete len:169 (+) Transcript_20321:253-759(+)
MASEGKHGGGASGRPKGGAIDFVDMEEHLTREASYSEEAREFIARHAYKFADATEDEHTLEQYACYQEYQSLYEDKIMTYLEAHGVAPAAFQRQCKDALRGPSEKDGGHREFIEVLLSAMEFPRFHRLMVTTAAMLPRARNGSDTSDEGADAPGGGDGSDDADEVDAK